MNTLLGADEPGHSAVGGHELLEILGRGGMGTVWKARQVMTGREVALKMISLPRALDPVAEQRFRGEIEAAAGLEHPHLVPVYEVGEADGILFYTMKWMRGGALTGEAGAALRAQGWRAVTGAMEKIARGVAWAHERGVLHRDLKPANILVDERGDPAVGDFGLAKMLTSRADGEASLTQSGEFTGTPPFMAPELLTTVKAPVTTAADVYGLGAVFYWLLTERAPFDGSTPAAVLRAVVEDEPARPSSLRPDLPRDLELICLHALEKQPARRYASATALADDLAHWLHGEPIAARPATRRERLRRWVRRHPAMAALILTAATGAAAIIALQFLHEHHLRSERDAARRSATLAQQKEHEARTAGTALAESLYAADMQLAWQAWENRDLGQARLLLARAGQPRAAGDAGCPRGFEWRMLSSLCQGDAATVCTGLPGLPMSITRVPSRGTFWLGGADWIHEWRPADNKSVSVLPRFNLPTLNWTRQNMHDQVRRRFPDAWPDHLVPRPVPESDHWLYDSNPEKTGDIRRLAVTPDATAVITAGGRWTRVWNVSGFAMRDLIPASDSSLSMDASGTWLAAGSRAHSDGSACLLNLRDDSPAWLPPWSGGHVALSADGTRLATGSVENQVRLWHTAERRLVCSPAFPDWICALALSPDGSLCAAAEGGRHVIHLFETTEGKTRAILSGHRGKVSQMAFSADGAWLASAAADQTVRLWPVQGEAPPVTELRGHTDHVTGLAFGASRTELATVSRDGTARLWSLSPPAPDKADWLIPEGPGSRYTFTISPDGRRLLVPSRHAPIKWLNLETGHHDVLPGEDCDMEGWAADGSLVSITAAGVLRFHTHEPPAITRSVDLEDGAQPFISRSLSPDGMRLATADAQQRVFIYDTGTGRRLHTFTRIGDNPPRFAWTRDHALLSVSSYEAALEVFDLRTGQRHWRAPRDSKIRMTAFSPDGLTLAAANYEPDRVVLFNVPTGEITGRLTGHMDEIYQCEWSPDGRTLASISNDRTVRLWHAAMQRELARPATDAFYERLLFAPDGTFLLHSTAGGKVRKLPAAR